MAIIERLRQAGVNATRLCLDSRRVERGDVFVALQGAARDGRDYVGDAINRGAVAVLSETSEQVIDSPVSGIERGAGFDRLASNGTPWIDVPHLSGILGEIAHIVYGRPSEKMHVVGVTGTNGKTSVSQWIAQALDALDQPCAVMGTLGNGFQNALVESPNTTPDAIAVHSNLERFLAQGARACAMEVSSIGLDQGRVNGVRFETAVFTNLSRDHLDYHADMKTYAEAKAKLFAMSGLGNAVLNLDDPFGLDLAMSLHGKLRVIGYSLDTDRRVEGIELLVPRQLEMMGSGACFEIDGASIATALIGRFNVSNVLAVYGVLKAMGINARRAAAVLARLTPPPGRLQVVAAEPLVVIDYAHTPDALDKALAALREVATARDGRLICVFGCGGDRDAGKRPLMGAVVERRADQAIVTNDNPRNEDPQHIVDQIVAGMRNAPPVELDRTRAICDAILRADARDVVLLAGKGHEPYQEIKGVKHPYSDEKAARVALERRP